MTVVIAKNQTASDILLSNLAVIVPASGQVDLTDSNYVYEIQADLELEIEISAGNIILNVDGVDLTKEQSAIFAQSTSDIAVKHNFTATADPNVNDDDVTGYSVGSRWVNRTTGEEFVCVDDSTGAAIWQGPTGDEVLVTSGEPLVVGDLVVFDSAGEVIRANSSIAGGNYHAIGVSTKAVAAATPVFVFTNQGGFIGIRFGSAPAAASNGSNVFLSSTNGVATLTPPTSVGNAVVRVGILQGADGVKTTPVVLWYPLIIALRP